MQFKQLGSSGLLVSDLCLGTMIFGEQNSRGTPEPESLNIIARYIDAGGNHIDTANVYAGGKSEEIVGKAIKGKRNDLVIATKVRFPMGDDKNAQGLSRFNIMNAVEASLRRLDTDYIDLYYMHAWDPLTPLEESLRAFDDLVQAGKVRYIGVSNFKAWQFMKALGISDENGYARFVAAQYQYSLVNREIEYEYLDLCLSEGVGITPWGPLGGGFLTGKYTAGERPTEGSGRIADTPAHYEESWEKRNTERNWNTLAMVEAIAKDHNASVSQISLAWLRMQPTVSSVIFGARTMEQLEDNLGAAEITLSDEQIKRLNDASALQAIYPYGFIAGAVKARLGA